MKKEIKNLPASVQDRLRIKAKELERPIDWMYEYYASERFLYRLSKSEHQQRFVLKGGLIFFSWGVPLRRHTKDIDLRAFTSNNLEDIIQMIKDMCVQKVEPDGIQFDVETVTAEVILEEAEYPGIRVHFWGRLGETNRFACKLIWVFQMRLSLPRIR